LSDASHSLDELRFTIAWRLILQLRADFFYGINTMAFLVDCCLLLDVLLNLLLDIVFLFYVLRFLFVRMNQLGSALLFVL